MTRVVCGLRIERAAGDRGNCLEKGGTRADMVFWHAFPIHAALHDMHATFIHCSDLNAGPQTSLQVAAAALDAAKHYQVFLDSFAKDGKPPDKVDQDNERHYLGACFSLGRVLHKAGGSSRSVGCAAW